MNVPNATTANPSLVAVNYITTGVLAKLPADLSSVIVEKRALIPQRYTSGALLINDNYAEWQNIGKLWLPFEVEVYGCGMWGSIVPTNPGFTNGGFIQYPLFAHNMMKRIKGAGNGGSRSFWWLASASGSGQSAATCVTDKGAANSGGVTSSSGIRVPLCFRIA